jgi:hypothetical protein
MDDTDPNAAPAAGSDTPITLDAGNGNEPPHSAAVADPAPEPTAAPVSAHPGHAWLDKLLDEFHNLDEIAKNRLHHIVERIRETL